MSRPANNVLTQARIQNQWQQDYVADLTVVSNYASQLVAPLDGKPTFGQLKSILMLAGVPNAHRLEVAPSELVTDPALAALQSVVPEADHFPYFTSATEAALAPLTILGRQLLAANDQDALATVIGYLPVGATYPDIGSLPATARGGDYATVTTDENGQQAYFEYHTDSGWQRVGDQRVTVTPINVVADLLSIANPKGGDLARSPTEVYQWDGTQWRQITQRLTIRHIVATSTATTVEAAWNAENLSVEALDVPIYDYQNVRYLYDGPQGTGLTSATNDQFIPLGVRPLMHREVSTEAERDALTDVLVGDLVKVLTKGYRDKELTYVYTGDATTPWIPVNDGGGRYAVNTFSELALVPTPALGDIAVVLAPTRQAYTYDGVDWYPWDTHKVEWRVIDAAGALPTIHNDFNNQHITVGEHDHVIYRYGGRLYLYVGPSGDPVQMSLLEHFVALGDSGIAGLVPGPALALWTDLPPAGDFIPEVRQVADLTGSGRAGSGAALWDGAAWQPLGGSIGALNTETFTATAGQAVFNLAQAPTTAANTRLRLRGLPRDFATDFTVAGTAVTLTMPSITVYAGDTIIIQYD